MRCRLRPSNRELILSLIWIVIFVLVLAAILGVPGVGSWNHGYGYFPSGVVGLLVIVLIVLLLSGRL